MADDKSKDMEDIKIRLVDDIPVEEDVEALKTEQSRSELAEEFKKFGKQFGQTLRNAWYSEERVRLEKDVREGVQSFAKEVDKAFGEVKESDVAAKARKEAGDIKSKVESSEITDKTRDGLAQGLHWFSQELEKLANQFTPVEKTPPAEEESEQ